MNRTEHERIAKFAKLIASYGHHPEDYDEGEEEDPRPYLSGELTLDRYVVVTVNYTSHGQGKYFFLSEPELRGAQDRAVLFAQDDLFEELPVAVVDLDTDREYVPSWFNLPWKEAASA
jgi:hypothetical protein